MQMLLTRSIAMLIAAVVVAALWRFPFAQIALTLGLGVYGAILYRYPHAWLIVIPALLPVVDLTPWSGRFFFDEIDFFVLVTLAVGLWRSGDRATEPHPQPVGLLLVLGLLVTSYTLSLVIGLLPLQALDANSFGHLYSHYNSIRIGKSFFEALALSFCLRGMLDKRQIINRFSTGVILGLTGAVLAVVWERWIFSGIFDFSSAFRVTATFSGLHNGGDDPEAYFVLAQPFILIWAWSCRKRYVYIVALMLFVASTYALLVTFSRAGYVGMAVSWVILILSLARRHQGAVPFRSVMTASVFIAAAVTVAIPILAGSYVRSRFATIIEDWNYRIVQSINSINVMDDDWMTRLLGMGLGKYPGIFYARKPLPITPANYRFEESSGNLFLRLFSGSPLYFEQYLDLKSGQKFMFSAKIRGSPRAILSVYICEKNLLYSFRCAPTIRLKADSIGAWSQQSAIVDAVGIGYSGDLVSWIWTRPIKLSLASVGPDPVDVDDIQLIDASGRNIVENGGFSLGMDRWFFATDDHLAWQVKNHWVHIYFEQGWVGVLSQFLFLIYVIISLIRLIVSGDRLAGALLASIGGFLTVGLFGFLFDTPRISLLFYLVSLASLTLTKEADRVGMRNDSG